MQAQTRPVRTSANTNPPSMKTSFATKKPIKKAAAKASSNLNVFAPGIVGVQANKLNVDNRQTTTRAAALPMSAAKSKVDKRNSFLSSEVSPLQLEDVQQLLIPPKKIEPLPHDAIRRRSEIHSTKQRSPRYKSRKSRGSPNQSKSPSQQDSPAPAKPGPEEEAKATEFRLEDHEMEFEALQPKTSEIVIPTAKLQRMMDRAKQPHQMSGLTGIRTGSDFSDSSVSSSNCSSMDFEADTNQDLHSVVSKRTQVQNKSFAKVISEEFDDESSMDERRPSVLVPQQLGEEDKNYDYAKADKKQKEVAYLSKFLSRDLGYTIEDVEQAQAENDKKAIGCSEEVTQQAAHLGNKVDALMARIIALTDFEENQPLGSIPEEEHN